MEKWEKDGHFSGKQSASNEIYDTRAQCSHCGAKLYVSQEGATHVLDSLHHTGMAGLICLCGHIEIVNRAILL